MTGMKSKLIILSALLPALLVLTLVLTLGACGKKPGFVDAPVGQASEFPRTYPPAEPSAEPFTDVR